MNRKEAEIVASIIGRADGGCGECVSSLCSDLSDAGLGYQFVPREIREEYVYPPDNSNRIVVDVIEG